MITPTHFNLYPEHFQRGETPIVQSGTLSASTFRFASGVCAVRLRSDRAEVVILPFQGQHIWSAVVDGRNLGWRSMVTEPVANVPFLATFGGFMQHCGISGVGGPSADDTHPLHGELPNAPYQEAWIEVGSDAHGEYLGLGGRFHNAIAFTTDYIAEPLVKLYPSAALFTVEMKVTNQAHTPLELFYLAHVNFLPVDNARLVYSAPSAGVRVRANIPSHVMANPDYAALIADLQANPAQHETIQPGRMFDPEVVFLIDYVADADGWGHTLQVHPDGGADYVRHRVAELPHVTRWISRTPNQDSLAMAEVGTSEPDGAILERKKGNALYLEPGDSFHTSFDVGALPAAEVKSVVAHVREMVARG